MKIKDLIEEAQTAIVSFSDLQAFSSMSSEFWIGMKDYIDEYKKIGKDGAIKMIVKRVKKIGKTNYDGLKSVSDKNRFNVPDFDIASNAEKLKSVRGGNDRIVVLMDLVSAKAKIRKAKLEANLKKLQQQIEQLED